MAPSSSWRESPPARVRHSSLRNRGDELRSLAGEGGRLTAAFPSRVRAVGTSALRLRHSFLSLNSPFAVVVRLRRSNNSARNKARWGCAPFIHTLVLCGCGRCTAWTRMLRRVCSCPRTSHRVRDRDEPVPHRSPPCSPSPPALLCLKRRYDLPEACYNTWPDSRYDSKTPACYNLAQEEGVAGVATSSSRLTTSASCATDLFETTSVPHHARRRRPPRCRRRGTSLPGKTGRRGVRSSTTNRTPTARDQDSGSISRAPVKTSDETTAADSPRQGHASRASETRRA